MASRGAMAYLSAMIWATSAFNSSATYNVLVKRVFERGHAGPTNSPLRLTPKRQLAPIRGQLHSCTLLRQDDAFLLRR